MNELTDAPEQGGTEETPAVEATSEATTEQPSGAEETAQADDAGEATEEAHTKRVPWFQKRIDEVTRQKYDAQREADYWRGLAEGRNHQTSAPQAQTEAPDMFEDPEGFRAWVKREAAAEAIAELKQQQSVRTYEERLASVRETKPDFDSVALDPSLPVSRDMAKVIYDSEKGPEVLYYLGQNRSEASRISALPPHLQAAALGRIEASLSAPAPTPQPKRNPPPPPPNTVAGLSSGINKDPEGMSMAEYIAARNAGTI